MQEAVYFEMGPDVVASTALSNDRKYQFRALGKDREECHRVLWLQDQAYEAGRSVAIDEIASGT